MIIDDSMNLGAMQTANPQRAREEASRQFESIFAYQMLKSMGDTVPEDGLLEEDSGGKLYKDMFYMEAAKTISQTDGLGIGRIIQAQLLKLNANK